MSSRFVDCELSLDGRHHARFSFDGRNYSGGPRLDAALERRLRELSLEPERYGVRLFEALFPSDDDLHTGYRDSLSLARRDGKSLRLRVYISGAAPPELHDLHWELLYDPKQKIALGRSTETALSRYLGVSAEPGRPVTGRPRLLVAIASPSDLSEDVLPPLDRAEVLNGLHQSLSPLTELMTWEVLEEPTSVERIRDRLVGGGFHALHLVAHGLLPQDESVAQLVLEDAAGGARLVNEEMFAEVFAGQRDLRLISLIACHGGVPSDRDPFSGLGPELVRRGVSAVVAMRHQISFGAAMRFTEHFYRNLARGGRVDAATNEARMQLYLDPATYQEWGTPALFMRLEEGQLWKAPQASEGVDFTGTGAEDESRPKGAVIKTLVVSELVDRERWIRELGDERMSEILRLHDRRARDLLKEHEGLEADGAGGFLALFELPLLAVRWALAFHQAIAELSAEVEVELACRVAIHQAQIILTETPAQDIARGARPLSAEGLDRQIATRLMSLAMGGQTLLSSGAFDFARRSDLGTVPNDQLRWLAHGDFLLPETSLAVFEVGVEGISPLRAPADTDRVQRAVSNRTIPGWRPGIDLEIPLRPSWVLEKKLSEGGFGEVWLARHKKISRRHVFKFCFEAERLRALQREITLLRLLKKELGDRDDIVRILDFNFENAPYFIESEYAADGDLVEWAKEQGGIENVPIALRLEIIAQLADALAAAHSVGVLHKDVKPTNVLIASGSDGALQVRLADFGIGSLTERERLAKAGITVLGMTTKTEESSSYSGTRLYMAPELLEGKPGTLQADVYAVGVMLYQIVIGDFTRALAPGWRRDVDDQLLCEDIAFAVDGLPERRLANALRIAERLRSLEDRRQMAHRAWLEQEQVRETQEALALSRRRNLVTSVIALLVIVGGIVILQSFRLADASKDAEHVAEVANQVSIFMVDLFEMSDPAVAKGATVTAREMLDQGAQRIRTELLDQPITQAHLMDTIGRVYLRLGLYDPAQPLLEDALRLRTEELGDKDPETAVSLVSVGELYRMQGRYKEAELLFMRSLAILGKAFGENHPDLVASLNGLGATYWRQGRFEEAESVYRRSAGILEGAGGSESFAGADTHTNIAILFSDQGRYEEAQPFYESALRILEKVRGSESPQVAQALQNFGTNQYELGFLARADSLYQRALKIQEKIFDPSHSAIGTSLNNLATLRWSQGRYDDAEKYFLRALEVKKKAFGPRHPKVARGLGNIAEVYQKQSLMQKAEVNYRAAIDIFEDFGADTVDISYPLHNLAEVLRGQGRIEEAESLYRRALAIRERDMRPSAYDVQETRRGLANILRLRGREFAALELERTIEEARSPE